MKRQRLIIRSTLTVLTLYLGVLSFMQYDVGLADNGDYSRLMTWFTSGPSGFDVSWPSEGSVEYHQRFFNYSLQEWKLDFPLRSRWVSSVLLVWFPGIILNVIFHDTTELYTPLLTVFPRLLSILFMVVLVRYIVRHGGHNALLLVPVAGVPYVLFASNTDFVAYFNSFYQEPATFCSIFLVFAAIVYYRNKPDTTARSLALAIVVLLLVSAKISNIYWSVLIALFVLPFGKLKTDWKLFLRYGLGIVVIPITFSLLQANLVGSRFDNAYQSIFCGALAFSDRADEHLEHLGLSEYHFLIDVPAYTPISHKFIVEHKDIMSHRTTLSLILREPVIAWRMLAFAADSMQRYELAHLGKTILVREEHGVRTREPYIMAGGWLPLARAWSTIKDRYAPRGGSLLLVFLALILAFLVGVRHHDRFVSDLSLVGILSVFGAVGDMWIEIFGDGKRDLIKHLVLPNLLFDVAIVIAAILFVHWLLRHLPTRQQEQPVPVIDVG